MEKIVIGNSLLSASKIALGCMRLGSLTNKEASWHINTAIEQGINFFDHADIYSDGEAEKVFAEAISNIPSNREKIIVQTKCGICDGYYDFSKKHIINSVDNSLKRLKTEYIDVLLLHRPDTLMEPEEISEAFLELERKGKVRHFGVSNQNTMQIEFLNQNIENDLIINQLQFSIMHTGLIDSGFNVNMKNDSSINRDANTLEYCRLNDITIQAWSPFQYGFFEGVLLDNDKFPILNKKLDEIAEIYNVTNTTIAIAWILRHPANIQPIVGTTNKERLKEICKASKVNLTRKQWYEIYEAAGNKLP